jgi:hypothetical protein
LQGSLQKSDRDLHGFAKRAAELTPGLDAIQATLKERSGLVVPRADLERVAAYLPPGSA